MPEFFVFCTSAKTALAASTGAALSDFVNPSTGVVLGTETFTHAGGQHMVATPKHAVDVALRIRRERGSGAGAQ